MLINATNLVFFDSTLYPGRLVIVLETDDRHELGLLEGPNMERAPTVEDSYYSGGGFEVFEVIRKLNPKPNQVLRYHFAATSLKSGAYVTYPTGRKLTLVESEGDWSVHFAGVEVALPDYGKVVLGMRGARQGQEKAERAKDKAKKARKLLKGSV